MDTLSYILDWIHGLAYLILIPMVLCFAWYWLTKLEDKWDTKHPAHHDSRSSSFWYQSHKKDNYR